MAAVDLEQERNDKATKLAAQLHPYPGRHHFLIKPLKQQPTMSEKIQAATHISTMGIHHSGISTQAKLMWPLREFTEYDVELMAARFLAHLLTALLPLLPHQQIDKIWIDQGEYLSFVEEPESPDENNPDE